MQTSKRFSNVNTVIRDKHKYSFVHQHLVFSICSLSSLTACQSAYAILRKCFCMFLLYYFVKQHLNAYNSSSLSHFPAFFNLVREHEWDVFANKTTVLEQNEEGNIPERSLTHMNTGSDIIIFPQTHSMCVSSVQKRSRGRKGKGLGWSWHQKPWGNNTIETFSLCFFLFFLLLLFGAGESNFSSLLSAPPPSPSCFSLSLYRCTFSVCSVEWLTLWLAYGTQNWALSLGMLLLINNSFSRLCLPSWDHL